MCDVVNKIKYEGFQKGRQEGIEEGENRFATLCQLLSDQKRNKELQKCFFDKAYRKTLFKEFGL